MIIGVAPSLAPPPYHMSAPHPHHHHHPGLPPGAHFPATPHDLSLGAYHHHHQQQHHHHHLPGNGGYHFSFVNAKTLGNNSYQPILLFLLLLTSCFAALQLAEVPILCSIVAMRRSTRDAAGQGEQRRKERKEVQKVRGKGRKETKRNLEG